MKNQKVTLILILAASLSFGQDPKETINNQSPLIVYSGGICAGSLLALNDELSDESQQYLKLSFSSIFKVRDYFDLFVDFDWLAPGNNFGGDVGFDYVFSRSGLSPLLGAGVGAHYFDKKGKNFGETFGSSATLHLGFMMDITDHLIIRIRTPYHVVFNEDTDHGIGLDIGFIFASKFRNIKRLHP